MTQSELEDKLITENCLYYMVLFIIVMILYAILVYTHPWIDSYTDFRDVKHTVLWYTNFKGERKFINLIGGQN